MSRKVGFAANLDSASIFQSGIADFGLFCVNAGAATAFHASDYKNVSLHVCTYGLMLYDGVGNRVIWRLDV